MKSQKAHIIGIAGIGMSATALLLKQSGWHVTGSDEGFYPPASTLLTEAGITVHTPHSPHNLPENPDLIVIGKHAKLTLENPEVAAAHTKYADRIKSYPEVLAELTRSRTRLVVAGSYGKSTCTSLLAWVLKAAGKEPGYFIGALPTNFTAHAALGQGPLFVMEGDEYPSSNMDSRAKFLHYHPHAVLLTSAAHDHVNIFPTQEDYLKPFNQLIEDLGDGLLVACADEPFAAQLAQEAREKGTRTVTYGLEKPADVRVGDLHFGPTSSFTLTHNGQPLGTFTTQLLGRHNVENMAGTAALCLTLGLLTPEELRHGFATFTGVRRRLDKLSAATTLPAYEGFGSSRDKARAAIDAVRLHFPDNPLAIVFEPHTFSWRNRETLHWYDDVFTGASHVFLHHPPSHGASSHAQLSQQDIKQRISAQNIPVTAIGAGDDAADLATIRSTLTPQHVLLILTSGNLEGLLPKLTTMLEEFFPTQPRHTT